VETIEKVVLEQTQHCEQQLEDVVRDLSLLVEQVEIELHELSNDVDIFLNPDSHFGDPLFLGLVGKVLVVIPDDGPVFHVEQRQEQLGTHSLEKSHSQEGQGCGVNHLLFKLGRRSVPVVENPH
jgi:hypothetical protein